MENTGWGTLDRRMQLEGTILPVAIATRLASVPNYNIKE